MTGDTTIILLVFIIVVILFAIFTEKGRSYASNTMQYVSPSSTQKTPAIVTTSYRVAPEKIYIPSYQYSVPLSPRRKKYLKKYNPHDRHYEESKFYNNDRSTDNDFTDEYRGRFKSNRDYREVEAEVQNAIKDSNRNETYSQWVNRNFDPIIPIKL